MYINTFFKCHRVTCTQSCVITKVHDLLGQPSYINGSKVYPGKSSFIFHSKNVAVNSVNDLRLIFKRSYISANRVYIKVPPVA